MYQRTGNLVIYKSKERQIEFHRACLSCLIRQLPLPPHVMQTGPLLASRQFVVDMARISEQLLMDDMPCDYWPLSPAPPSGSLPRRSSREVAAWPDKCGDISQLEEVQRRRAEWAMEIGKRYRARVVEWFDTGESLEKQAALLLLRPPRDAPVAVVAWRGSKKLADYLVTDLSLTFVPVVSSAIDSERTRPGA